MYTFSKLHEYVSQLKQWSQDMLGKITLQKQEKFSYAKR